MGSYPFAQGLIRTKWQEQQDHVVGLGAVPAFGDAGQSSDAKPTNPKDLIGSDKIPVHLWPMTATIGGALALMDGALKYGRCNWREAGVRYSIYYDAAMRHLAAAMEGEDTDPDSGLPHEWHALACLAILVDAKAAGKLVDDRQYPGGYRGAVTDATPNVARLKRKYASRNTEPKHWTRQDVCDVPTKTTGTLTGRGLDFGPPVDAFRNCVSTLDPHPGSIIECYGDNDSFRNCLPECSQGSGCFLSPERARAYQARNQQADRL